MIGRVMDFIGARATGFVLVLALLVAGNVLVQLWMHRTTPLTAWKGGGFGMYTEPHAETRTVWAVMQGADGVAHLRLWPEDRALADWRETVPPASAAFLARKIDRADRFRYFPRDRLAEVLKSDLARVRYPDTITGGVAPRDGRTFGYGDIRIEVYEHAYDLGSGHLRRVPVYSHPAGAQ